VNTIERGVLDYRGDYRNTGPTRLSFTTSRSPSVPNNTRLFKEREVTLTKQAPDIGRCRLDLVIIANVVRSPRVPSVQFVLLLRHRYLDCHSKSATERECCPLLYFPSALGKALTCTRAKCYLPNMPFLTLVRFQSRRREHLPRSKRRMAEALFVSFSIRGSGARRDMIRSNRSRNPQTCIFYISGRIARKCIPNNIKMNDEGGDDAVPKRLRPLTGTSEWNLRCKQPRNARARLNKRQFPLQPSRVNSLAFSVPSELFSLKKKL